MEGLWVVGWCGGGELRENMVCWGEHASVYGHNCRLCVSSNSLITVVLIVKIKAMLKKVQNICF